MKGISFNIGPFYLLNNCHIIWEKRDPCDSFTGLLDDLGKGCLSRSNVGWCTCSIGIIRGAEIK